MKEITLEKNPMCVNIVEKLSILPLIFKDTNSPWRVLRKMPLTKKAHEKSLTSIEQSLMAGPKSQAGQGKDGAAQSLGQEWLL
jgi:hypothetical protein